MYTYKDINIKLTDYGDRRKIRKQIVLEFLKEEPGTGPEYLASRYKYHVETLADANEIILTRPTAQGHQMLRGFDFRVDVPGINFNKGGRARYYPSFEHIEKDLKLKRGKHPRLASQLLTAIDRIHKCEDVEKVVKDYDSLDFGSGFSVEFLLKVINWLFIEQDMRDWNYSGRNMFYGGIKNALK